MRSSHQSWTVLVEWKKSLKCLTAWFKILMPDWSLENCVAITNATYNWATYNIDCIFQNVYPYISNIFWIALDTCLDDPAIACECYAWWSTGAPEKHLKACEMIKGFQSCIRLFKQKVPAVQRRSHAAAKSSVGCTTHAWINMKLRNKNPHTLKHALGTKLPPQQKMLHQQISQLNLIYKYYYNTLWYHT